MQNYLLWIIGLILIGVAVYGNSYYAMEPLLYRVIGVLVVLILSLLVILRTVQGKEALTLILDSRKEIRRVVWPTRTETTQTTLIVIAAITFMGLVLWGLDSFNHALEYDLVIHSSSWDCFGLIPEYKQVF